MVSQSSSIHIKNTPKHNCFLKAHYLNPVPQTANIQVKNWPVFSHDDTSLELCVVNFATVNENSLV